MHSGKNVFPPKLEENNLEHPLGAHGIEAEIPQDLWSKAEELERKARFAALGICMANP
jgi:hypothetical protein